MVMGTMLNVYAGENNPVKHGNVIRGHVIEKETEEPVVTDENIMHTNVFLKFKDEKGNELNFVSNIKNKVGRIFLQCSVSSYSSCYFVFICSNIFKVFFRNFFDY